MLSVACFNFFFIPPYYTLAVADLRHVVTFVVMLRIAKALGVSIEELAAAVSKRLPKGPKR